MPKQVYRVGKQRIPPEVDGIQVNFCKNPACPNFGVPAIQVPQRGRHAGKRTRDTYAIAGGGKKCTASLRCHLCGGKAPINNNPIKSNLAISEELKRIKAYLDAETRELSCPVDTCTNHGIPVSAGKKHYSGYGQTNAGSKKYKCKACGKIFSTNDKIVRRKQRRDGLGKLIFKDLIGKKPLRCIADSAETGFGSIYNNIDIIYERCRAFAANHEIKLLNGELHLPRLYVSADRQEYYVNWKCREDRTNVKLHAIGAADNESGYVFGMHVNFDPVADREEAENYTDTHEEYEFHEPYRRYARVWLKRDFADAVERSREKKQRKEEPPTASLVELIRRAYKGTSFRFDTENPEKQIAAETALPQTGMLVHAEYAMYAYFFFLKDLLGKSAGKIRFFLDQDSGIRGACLGAFHQEIKDSLCDAFFVQINHSMTKPQKMAAAKHTEKFLNYLRGEYPGMDDMGLRIMTIKKQFPSMKNFGPWKDRWMIYPFPNIEEPEMLVCHLSDFGQYAGDEDHLARLYNRASMRGINRFFNYLRRKVSELERPITSASSNRTFNGYSPYNPEIAIKLIEIARVYYNYCHHSRRHLKNNPNPRTPAQKLGLTSHVVNVQEILDYL